MAESVTVDHGSVSITTNTASEADLRAEMEAPADPTPSHADPHDPTPAIPHDPTPPGPVRDEHGRFAKADPAAPPADGAAPEEPPAEPSAEPAPPTRRRDDALPRHSPIARMQQALAQKAEADRRAAALEAELARYRQQSAPSQVPTPSPPPPGVPAGTTGQAEPQFDQFANEPDPYTAYVQAWTRWDRAQALAAARAEWDAEQSAKTRAREFETRLAAGRTAYPDFDKVLGEADTLGLQVSAVMQDAIAESPKAADLVYYLATHPEECLQLAEESQQTPVAAAPVMRRLLETKIESHPAPRAVPSNGTGAAARATVSTAKPPVTPVGSSPVMSDEPPGESASAAEHARYWNRRLKVPGTI